MIKKLLSAALAATMMLTAMPVSHAASDIDNHWAKQYITALHELEIINPSPSGAYTPEAPIARWEFMRYINRAFDFTEKAQINFTDVPANAAYYDTIATAVYYGYINGVGNDRMDPLGTLTREQAATILGRLHKYAPESSASSLPFLDRDQISSYSRDYVAEAVARGYINGYTDGTFKPQSSLKRGEIAKILYFYMGSALNKRGTTYTGADLRSDTKNLSITQPCTLSNATIEGNLYITEGVGSGRVDLQNVTVEGRIIVSGGENILSGVSALDMTISNPCGQLPSVTCTGNTSIANVDVLTSGRLYESNLAVSAGGFSNLNLDGPSVSLTLDAAVWNLNIKQLATVLTTGSTVIDRLTADARSMVTGGGSIQRAKLNVTGCELIMQPSMLELASGVVATVAGERVQAANSITISPATLTVDVGNSGSIASYYDFTFNADKNDLTRITVDSIGMSLGTDYALLDDRNGIRLYRSFLSTLDAGTHNVRLTFTDGSSAAFTVTARDSSIASVSPQQVTFDLYTSSPNHTDIPLTLALPSGTSLDSVKIGSAVLEQDIDYSYSSSSGRIVLFIGSLEKRSVGSHTLSFVPSRGSTVNCTLNVVDTRPVNRVAPSAVDFDANPNSGGNRDIVVTLTAADGARLDRIICEGRTLEQDVHYRVSGSQITLNKASITELTESNSSYTEFRFDMTVGQDPTLRVNFVTTYPLSAQVVDDLGNPIRDAIVTFSPTDSATGSAAQTAVTDADGRAAVYVKRGSYTVTAAHERFTRPIAQTIDVTSSSRSVRLTGEILENVQIVVTNRYGAMLQGASVTIGGISVTTGADGVASFSLRRSDYTVQAACTGYDTATMSIKVTDSMRLQMQLED